MEITIKKLSEDTLKKKGVFNWPIWEKEASRFDWSINKTGQIYF